TTRVELTSPGYWPGVLTTCTRSTIAAVARPRSPVCAKVGAVPHLPTILILSASTPINKLPESYRTAVIRLSYCYLRIYVVPKSSDYWLCGRCVRLVADAWPSKRTYPLQSAQLSSPAQLE